jgi:class 3 adenylate cyclase
MGVFASGAVNALLAATHPHIPRALVWFEPSARYSAAPDYPWGRPDEDRELERQFSALWGTVEYEKAFLEDEASKENPFSGEIDLVREAMQSRSACTPDVAAQLADIWYEIDVRAVLAAVQVPALLLVHEGRSTTVEAARYIASQMPAAQLRTMPGRTWTGEETPQWADAVREFVGVEHPHASFDTVLATVLFTDIVASTEREAAIGDRAWRSIRQEHDRVIRAELSRFGGREIKTMGDGFLVTFDGPARGVKCAATIAEAVQTLGIEIRAGLHTGEVRFEGDDVSGLGVAIGARVAAQAHANEVLVSQTVKDLVAGSGLQFEDAGEHELKGVPDRWRLYRVANSADRDPQAQEGG